MHCFYRCQTVSELKHDELGWTRVPALLCNYARLRGPWTAVIFPRWSQLGSKRCNMCWACGHSGGPSKLSKHWNSVYLGISEIFRIPSRHRHLTSHRNWFKDFKRNWRALAGLVPQYLTEHDTNIHTSYNPCANPQQRYLIFHWPGKRRMTDDRHEI